MIADILAKLDARTTSNLVIANNPLIKLELILLANVIGVPCSYT